MTQNCFGIYTWKLSGGAKIALAKGRKWLEEKKE